ncbi:hypothetical protein IAD21_00810 [Abditibacteriota bacterium]|nr:hypothetical protein IAD21_00810 [Abditibacteriota bacterium]
MGYVPCSVANIGLLADPQTRMNLITPLTWITTPAMFGPWLLTFVQKIIPDSGRMARRLH